MLVVGAGIIGLEMATVYSTLGTRIDVVEMLDIMMAGADRDLVKVWEKMNAKRFDKVMLKTKTVSARRRPAHGIEVALRGRQRAGRTANVYDLVLVAVGRSPNGKAIDADEGRRGGRPIAASSQSTSRCARTSRTSSPSATSSASRCWPTRRCTRDTSRRRPRRARSRSSMRGRSRRWPTPIPEVAWAGLTEDQCKEQGIKYGKAVFPWAASGRAIANGRDEGFTKLLFDEATHRCIGGGIVGTHAGDLIGEVCLAVEMGCDPARHRQDHPSASDA